MRLCAWVLAHVVAGMSESPPWTPLGLAVDLVSVSLAPGWMEEGNRVCLCLDQVFSRRLWFMSLGE